LETRQGEDTMQHDSIQFDSPLPVVEAWQDALDRRDVNRLLELSDPDIEISGPQGSGYPLGVGHDVLRDWLGSAELSLQTSRAFVRGETVVLAQHTVLRAQSTSEVAAEEVSEEPNEPAPIASRFLVSEGRVIRIQRYETLEAALADTGLDASDEMTVF
jgi:hypothetical protein